MTSYDVRIYAIETRKRQTTRYRVRWTVAGKRFGETFASKGLAESYRAALITAAREARRSALTPVCPSRWIANGVTCRFTRTVWSSLGWRGPWSQPSPAPRS